MPTITSAGIGSGLDIESLLSRLVAAERIPVTQVSRKTDTLKTQLSTFGKVQSTLSALRDAAAKLTKPDTWGGTLASSSDPTAVSVTAGAGASVGVVTVQVEKLASSQTLSSTSFGSSSSTVSAGNLTIQLGTWGEVTDDQGNITPTFTDKSGSNAVSISVAEGATLSQVRDQINGANAGVLASIVTDSSGARLVLRSSSTGETNGFNVAADGGLANLAYDPRVGPSSMLQAQPAANARAILNGIQISSETNTLKSAIDGLNITLLKTTTIPPTLSVGQDKEAIKKAVTDFSTAYNAVNALLREQTKYDEGAKTAGLLQGDATAVALQSQLRAIVGGTSSLGGSLNRLAQIGLDPGSDGNLSTSSTKLDTALADLDSLKTLFMGLDSNDSANSGFAQRIRAYTDGALSTEGRLSSRQTGLQKAIDENGKRQARLEDHVAQTEARLRARYNALDTQVGRLNGLSNYVTQQLAQFNKS